MMGTANQERKAQADQKNHQWGISLPSSITEET